MSYEALANVVRQQASLSSNDRTEPKLCTISSYDPANHAVQVLIQPQGIPSNWMPLGAVGIGNGWGVAVGPEIGDQVLVSFEGADSEGGVIVARIFSVAQQAIAVPSGEIWAVHKTGSYLKFMTDGDVALHVQGNLSGTVVGNMDANVIGNVSVEAGGSASVTAAGSASVTAPTINLGAAGQALRKFVTDAFVALFNGHTHTSENPGIPTSTPNQTMGSAHTTSTVSGG